MCNRLKLVFMGSSSFSFVVFESLCNLEVVKIEALFIKQKNLPRKRKKEDFELEREAVRNNIPVFFIKTLKDEKIYNQLKSYSADIYVVVDFGAILPVSILSLPKFGAFNVHASLLPEYRGASPIQQAIIDGREYTGITIMKMDKGLDTGNIIFQEKVFIDDNDDYFSLSEKLSKLGAELMVKTISFIREGKRLPEKVQDDSKATYTYLVKKFDAKINWEEDAYTIWRKIRAYIKWPVCFSYFNYKNRKILVKLFEALPVSMSLKNSRCGEIVKITKDGIIIKCGKESFLMVKRIQPEGKRIMSHIDFVNGFRIKVGDMFVP